MSAGFTGRKHSEETKVKMRIKKIGNTNRFGKSSKGKLSDEIRRKISKAMKGKIKKIGHRKKISISVSGEKSINWKGGITPENKKIRQSFEYKLWREAVFKRDDYTCVWCKKRGVKLNADHIKPFALFPELRFAIDNGRTLCLSCHKTTETYGRKTRNLLIPKKL